LAFALTLATSASADPGAIASKQAQEQSVLGQIQELDGSLDQAVEAYNLANVKLAAIRHDLTENTAALGVAKKSLHKSRTQLARRLVDIYTSGDTNAGLAVLLGAQSLDDMLNQMDTEDRISAQDTLVVKQVAHFNREVQHRERALKQAHAEQVQVVAERNAARASIESQLGERRALLGSIQGEITRLKAEEAAHQAELRRQLQTQLAQQQSSQQASLAPTVPVTAPTPSAPPSVAPPATHGGVVGIAMQYLGTPYVWGGASPSGFDCSGFVMYVYAQVGVSLPHSSYAQYGYGSPVSRGDLQPGDLVFFDGLGHVGIYVGGGNFIHAPHTGDVVKISSLSGWYASTFVGGRRL
jgi:cell wall-associated NlpC family hydrolase